ncbi:alpha/beta hydrolase [Okeanomitos corallinicola TIOX110]|uniref:Alpha/beta hydrolase n=1 Tax=Okeanomitos corallinicola TIOX110 TaxID=3133117 RepID=A0ABZ2UP58_9CYAN
MTAFELKPCFLTPNHVKPEYPLFIYLPGMDGTGELLRSQTAKLELGFDIRCLTIPKQDLSSWDVLTRNVLDLIHAELEKSSHRPVYLCGESFGGCLAMKIVTQSSYLFKRVILVNPASSFHLQSWLTSISQVTNVVPSWLYSVGALGLLPFLASLSRISNSDRQKLLAAMRSVPAETINWRLSLLREFKIEEEKLQKLKQEVLLIAGGNDRLLPSVSEIQRLNDILPNAHNVILPSSGHACLLEKDVNLYTILQENEFVEAMKNSYSRRI